ncbi:acyl carrier protein [Vibrio sp.]|nr:acyl carrier protein [Vibrio sp.]
MNRSNIVEIVQTIIGNVLQTEVNLNESDVNLFDLGLDSMTIVDFLVVIEEEFDLEIDESELKEDMFTSAYKIIDFIEHSKGL